MKLSAREAAPFCARPDGRLLGALLYGQDAGQVLEARRTLVTAVLGGDDDLRLDQIEPGRAARDPNGLDVALRARGFFPGRRVALIEGAGDGLSETLKAVLPGVTAEDAFLVLTAGILPTRSSLRKLFEGHDLLAAAPFYPDPPNPADVARRVAEAGAACGLSPAARDYLTGCAAEMDHGAFVQLVGVIGLYGMDREAPLEVTDIEALAPLGIDGATDQLVQAVANGVPGQIGPLLRRLGGAAPVGLTLAVARHFRQLLALVHAPDGPDKAVARLRPPVFGPRRSAIVRQTRNWGPGQIEAATRLLFETDRRLRSPGQRPDMALVERCLLRLAMMGARR